MNSFLQSAIKQFEYYKLLGEKTFDQLNEEKLFWQYNNESNSIYVIVKHLNGNMLSRWTDFLTSDGEKEWRKRDNEFENDNPSKQQLLQLWNDGWNCLFNTLDSLTIDDLERTIYIRNQGQTVVEAINRQLCHYSYHVGQIVFLGKMICNEDWKSLSIPKNQSQQYNASKFSQEKHVEHFTDQSLKKE